MAESERPRSGGSETASGRETNAQGEGLYTRREWLTRHMILGGSNPFLAKEAVASTAIEHPDWDMDGEKKTMAQWDMMENQP